MKDITNDLADRLALLHVRHEVAFAPYGTSNPAYREIAERLVALLHSGGDVTRVRAAVDPADLGDTAFWATPLGRLLFAAGGYGPDSRLAEMGAADTVQAALAEAAAEPGVQ